MYPHTSGITQWETNNKDSLTTIFIENIKLLLCCYTSLFISF